MILLSLVLFGYYQFVSQIWTPRYFVARLLIIACQEDVNSDVKVWIERLKSCKHFPTYYLLYNEQS